MDSIYLAGRFDRKDELRGYAQQLTALGYHITSRWLTGAHDTSMEGFTPEELGRFAAEDLMDIEQADALIAFAESPDVGFTSGGRHVELGYALELGMKVAIVGGHENVFHHLHGVKHFDTFADVLASREAIRAKAIATGEWSEDVP